MKYFLFSLFAAALLLSACKNNQNAAEFEVIDGITYYNGKKTNNLVYQIANDPETMALWQQQTASRKDLKAYIHGWLYYNQDDGSLIPGLAKGDMTVSDDGLTYTVEIHPDAKWEDGKPIDVEDVIFSLKVAICPLSDNQGTASYLEFFKELKQLDNNPKRFQFTMKSYYILNYLFLSNIPIIDKRVYDPNNVLDKYSIEQLRQPAMTLAKDATLQQWVTAYKDNKFGREPQFVKGAGMYELAKWNAGQEIILKKKAKFWAKNLHGKYYDQYPDSLTFKVVKEPTAIEMGFKQQQLDVSGTLSGNVFNKLKNDPQVAANYNFFSGLKYSFTLGVFNLHTNAKKPNIALKDLNVRKAIAYLCPIQEIIDQITEGFAVPIASPVYIGSPQYNQKLSPIAFMPSKADSLLNSAGWKDSDGDKILDKMINGKKVKLSLSIIYNNKSGNGELVVKRVQSELQKAGIETILVPSEQNVLMEKLNAKDFDMIFIGIAPGSSVTDFKEMWSRGSASNYGGFGTAETDKLIEEIRITKDKNKFKTLSDSIQKIIYEQQPVVFFYNAKGRSIVHKRFNHADKLDISDLNLNTLEMKRK